MRTTRGMGMVDGSDLWLHHLPASPIMGEVSLHSWNTIQFYPQLCTSPLMGEAGRGWSSAHRPMETHYVR